MVGWWSPWTASAASCAEGDRLQPGAQPFVRHRHVALRGLHARVTEQLGNEQQIVGGFVGAGGVPVAQTVRRLAVKEPGQVLADVAGFDVSLPSAGEQIAVMRGDQIGQIVR